MNRYRPKSRVVPRRKKEQPYLFEGMHDRYGFDTRAAVGEYYERLVQAIYGGYSPSKHEAAYGINIDPDLTNGHWWRESKAMNTSERLHLRHVQLWRYLILMSRYPHKRFHCVLCRYRTDEPLKYYKDHPGELEPALAGGLKMIIQLPFSVIFRVAMLPEDRDKIYRLPGESIRYGDSRFYMVTWWQCGRVRELADQGISALKRMGIPNEQYREYRFKCRLQGTNDFEMLHIHEKKPSQAQRDLLEEYDDDVGYFIDLENGIYDGGGIVDTSFFIGEETVAEHPGSAEESLMMEDTADVPF